MAQFHILSVLLIGVRMFVCFNHGRWPFSCIYQSTALNQYTYARTPVNGSFGITKAKCCLYIGTNVGIMTYGLFLPLADYNVENWK